MHNSASYVIITPAFNEAGYIERTIETVLQQTIRPARWILVDDGSTDATGAIIQRYAAAHDFIHYHRRHKPAGQAYFASNVFAIMEGFSLLEEQDFAFLAILDADILLPNTYYQQILNRFADDQKLGVASGIYENLVDRKLQPVLSDRRSTPKAIQVFRREVFDSIGGFLPLPYGGEDTIACVMARMHGWKVWSFPEIKVVHLRPTGTGAAANILRVRFRQGICEYHLATHPLFLLLKCFRRSVLEPPFFIGGVGRLAGYIWAAIRGDERDLPEDVIQWLQDEQIHRILNGNRLHFQ